MQKFFKLIIWGFYAKIGFDFQNNFLCLYFDKKYITGAIFVRIWWVVWTQKLKTGNSIFYKKTCKGHNAGEWVVDQLN